MRACAIALLVALMAVGASANPQLYPDNMHLDLGGSNCIWPSMSELITVRVYLGDLSLYSQQGITAIAFRFERTFYGFLLESESLLGGPGYGLVEDYGWVSTSGGDCAYPNEWDVIPVARFLYLYLGLPGTIEVQPHLVEGATFVTCASAEEYSWNYYDMYYMSYAGVGMESPYGCGPVTPVTQVSWGAIKSLYR
jgi:hypothetical protein